MGENDPLCKSVMNPFNIIIILIFIINRFKTSEAAKAFYELEYANFKVKGLS